MFILRAGLYFVCLLSLLWSVAVFGGPAFIKYAVNNYSDSKVSTSKVTVTPRLNIIFDRLNFSEKGGFGLNGFSRSVSIAWSLSKNQPFMTFELGPTVVEDILVADRIKIYTPALADLKWNDLEFRGLIENFSGSSFFDVDRIEFDGTVTEKFSEFAKLKFELFSAIFSSPIVGSLKSIEISIERLKVNQPVFEQTLNTRFVANRLSLKSPLLDILDISGELTHKSGVTKFNTNLDNLEIEELNGGLKSLKVGGIYSLLTGLEKSRVEVTDWFMKDSQIKITEIVADLTKSSRNNYLADVDGILEDSELYLSDNYIGKIPASQFNLNIEVDPMRSLISGVTQLNFKGLKYVQAHLSGHFDTNLVFGDSIFNCFTNKCYFSNSKLNNQLNIDNEWIRVASHCKSPVCDFLTMTHKFSTSHTRKIFEIISSSKLFNPLIIAYYYTAILAAEKLGEGHRFTVN